MARHARREIIPAGLFLLLFLILKALDGYGQRKFEEAKHIVKLINGILPPMVPKIPATEITLAGYQDSHCRWRIPAAA